MAGDGLAEVAAEDVPKEAEESAKECQENCPASVIEVG